MNIWKTAKYVLLGFVLASCGGGGGSGSTGSIGGTVGLNLGPAGAEQGEFVPGELIVRFKPVVSVQSAGSLEASGIQAQRVRALGLPNTALYRASIGADQTLILLQAVRQRPDVQYAQLNYIMKAAAVPNDEFFNLQWHYNAFNLPAAWDIEKGLSNPVTVAVVDTGILSGHPDFAGKILPGFDFISDIRQSNDGNGRDPNPEDVGDKPGEQSTYHGSHVAGTVAAATNNGIGVAGVSWGAKIVPVRVLGVEGGTIADIADGVLWAAGVSVPGVPANANPAQVINLSITGKNTCDQVPIYQDAFDQANAKGAIVVVAAGNGHENASLYSPASCSGIITVGATETRNFRAYYSNFGPRIDVMAPGGDVTVDRNNDTKNDGVLSLGKNDQAKQFFYPFYQGTSMASPHIAGLVALMKSKKPSLTFSEALDILKRSAKPLNAATCTGRPSPALDQEAPNFPNLNPGDCGAGLVDAAAALKALDVGPAPTPDFSLSLAPSSINLAPGGNATVTLNLARVNNFTNAVNLSLSGAPAGASGSFSSNATPGNTSTLSLNVASSTTPGTYALMVQASGGGLTRSASLSLLVQTAGGGGQANLGGTIVLACYPVIVKGLVNCDDLKSGALQLGGLAGKSTKYRMDGLGNGGYYILGWKDVNNNKLIDSGDYLGAYQLNGDLALVNTGNLSADFGVDAIVSTSSLPSLTPPLLSSASSLMQAAAHR